MLSERHARPQTVTAPTKEGAPGAPSGQGQVRRDGRPSPARRVQSGPVAPRQLSPLTSHDRPPPAGRAEPDRPSPPRPPAHGDWRAPPGFARAGPFSAPGPSYA